MRAEAAMAKRANWIAWDYLWPYGSWRYQLRTRLTPEQCGEQLKLHVAARAGGRVPTPTYDAVAGSASTASFRIRRDDNIFVTPCPIVASGKVTPTDNGSRLTIRVGTEETGLIVVSLWLLGWSLFLLTHFLVTFSSSHSGPPNFLFWIFWLLGYGILVLSRWQGRYDGPVLMQFLCEVLKAEEEPVDATPTHTMPSPAGPPASIHRGTGR
jgi:hypothetical protein